jgi:hypothetical protein
VRACEPAHCTPPLDDEVVLDRDRRVVAEALGLVDGFADGQAGQGWRCQVVVDATKNLQASSNHGEDLSVTLCGAL